MSIIAANVRDPVVAEGDLYSLTACNDYRRPAAAGDDGRFLHAGVDAVGERFSTLARRHAGEIRALPAGDYHNRMQIDGYDEPVDLVCTLSVGPDRIAIDFAGSSPESAQGINVPLPYTEAYASFGVRCMVGNDIPNNAGSLETIEVTAPDGCILNARRPGRCRRGTPSARCCRTSSSAAWIRCCPAGCRRRGLLHLEPRVPQRRRVARTRRMFVINPIFNGGTGARRGKDGLSTTAFPSGVRTTPTEVNEVDLAAGDLAQGVLAGLRRRRRAARRPGPGDRGGPPDGAPFVISKMFDRIEHPARGRHGGGDGALGEVFTVAEDGTQVRLAGKGRDEVKANHRLVLRTPGGGGLGDASERDAALE